MKYATDKTKQLIKEHAADHRGENNPSAKLTISKVLFIRSALESKEATIKELSIKFNMSEMAIRNVFLRKTWKNI